jgi:hypothetical protein
MIMFVNDSGNVLWLENPEVEITLTDETMRAKIKQMFMEAELELPSRKSVTFDPVMSKRTGFQVGYIRRSWLRDLLVRINKKCDLSVDTTASIVKMHTNNGIFILATHDGRGKKRAYLNFCCVQREFEQRYNLPRLDCTYIYHPPGTPKPAYIQIIR